MSRDCTSVPAADAGFGLIQYEYERVENCHYVLMKMSCTRFSKKHTRRNLPIF